MAQYGGIYRGFCVDGEGLRVTIPQIFGEELVPLYSWVGARPQSQQFGVISFLSGDPSYPVWLGPQEINLGGGDTPLPPSVTAHSALSGLADPGAHPAAAITAGPFTGHLAGATTVADALAEADGITFEGAAPSDDLPEDLGVAAAGTDAAYSRADHKHKLPTYADVGAAAAGHDHDGDYAAVDHDHAGTYVEPGDLAAVATSGDYDDLSNTPTLGTAAAADTGDFATSAQGSLADTAVQPGDLGGAAYLDVGTTPGTVMAGDTVIPDVSGYGDIVTHDASEFATAGHNHDGTYAPYSLGYRYPFEVVTGEYLLLSQGLGTGYSATTPAASATNSNNLAIYFPFVLDRTRKTTELQVNVTAANAGGSAALRLGIHNNSSGRPGTTLLDAGTQTVAATGIKTFTFTEITLTAHTYYWGVVVFQNIDTGGTNPSWAGVNTPTGPAAPDTTPAATNNMFPYFTSSSISGALADNPTTSITRSLTPKIPHIWMKVTG